MVSSMRITGHTPQHVIDQCKLSENGEELAMLFKKNKSDSYAVSEIASNPHTPHDVLMNIASMTVNLLNKTCVKDHEKIMESLLLNPSADEAVLVNLLGGYSRMFPYIQRKILASKKLSKDFLMSYIIGMSNKSTQEIAGVLMNPNMDAEILGLVVDFVYDLNLHADIKMMIIEHPCMTEEIMWRMIRMPDNTIIRIWMLNKMILSKESIQILLFDKDKEVVARAIEILKSFDEDSNCKIQRNDSYSNTRS